MSSKNILYGLAAVVVAVLLWKRKAMINTIRSVRNNNPGNIRDAVTYEWDGQTGRDNGGYAVFESAEWGFRAMTILLRNYRRFYGADTIPEIINKWAPDIENNTLAYIDSVAKQTGLDLDEVIDTEEETLALIKAISKHEAGVLVYSDEVILKGMSMA